MPQQTPDTNNSGAAHTLIVRLRREPGSAAWRVQIVDVHSGATTALSIAADEGDDMIAPFIPALAVTIERLLGGMPTKDD